VQLATRLKQFFSNRITIKIIDGGITGLDDIYSSIETFKPDLLGVSVLTPTYGEGLKIAKKAKTLGARVVLGDDHATFFPKEILSNRPYVDFVIANDVGEQPFLELVKALYYEKPLSQVSSLAYRANDGVRVNPAKKYLLSVRNTIPDLSLIEDSIDTYSSKYFEAHGHLHGKRIRSITMNNARGCENGRVRCSYCSIADLSINTGSPFKHWEIVRRYHEDYGINLFFEVYDSFTASPKYTQALLETMPRDLKIKIEQGDIEFMIYARALGLLKKNNVKKFQQLGIRRVNIGLDSGDNTMLEAQRKNKTSNETNLSALKLLKQANMSVHASFMLGAPGETSESVENTMNHIDDCMESVDFSSIEVSRLFPLPNSPIWDILVQHEKPQFYKSPQAIREDLKKLSITPNEKAWKQLSEKYYGRDLFTAAELMPDWYQHFMHVEEAYVLEAIAKLDKKIASKHIQTGNNIG
jgi:radical SAM superfamily enzyme YgiQ (UPF0313 family)